ncbi:hypothetical protein HW555_003906 [Spodoptera exigua]|uniref:Uncharacterized protein n=1 Tax=Spodoptera exigua TaxID=7107 RepID=A0A835GN19_SPOEX|nr:hypothetical protein HW555_003906 [Spodoptera exigua]
MPQLAEVLSAQKSLEECFMKKMNALEAQIQTAGPAKDTVAKVAEEFRAFRDLVIGMLGLLRRQIGECSRQLDDIETRSRRKALIIQGIAEAAGEDCTNVTLGVINTKLGLNYTKSSIKVCHRLGQANTNHHRPILVRFASIDARIEHRPEEVKLNVFIRDQVPSTPTHNVLQEEPLLSDMTLDQMMSVRDPVESILPDEGTQQGSRTITTTSVNFIAREPSPNDNSGSPSILTDNTHRLNIEKILNLPNVTFADISPLPRAST